MDPGVVIGRGRHEVEVERLPLGGQIDRRVEAEIAPGLVRAADGGDDTPRCIGARLERQGIATARGDGDAFLIQLNVPRR